MSNETENSLMEISMNNVAFQFNLNNQTYVLITEDEEMDSDEGYLAKLEELEDGTLFIRAIDDEEEYKIAETEFNKLIDELEIFDDQEEEEDV